MRFCEFVVFSLGIIIFTSISITAIWLLLLE